MRSRHTVSRGPDDSNLRGVPRQVGHALKGAQ